VPDFTLISSTIEETITVNHDAVNHPSHYQDRVPGVECIDVVQHFNFNTGNAIKYLWRAGYKGNILEDLAKARQYIDFEVARIIAELEAGHGELVPQDVTDEIKHVLETVTAMETRPTGKQVEMLKPDDGFKFGPSDGEPDTGIPARFNPITTTPYEPPSIKVKVSKKTKAPATKPIPKVPADASYSGSTLDEYDKLREAVLLKQKAAVAAWKNNSEGHKVKGWSHEEPAMCECDTALAGNRDYLEHLQFYSVIG
jgi:hypothetical protein